VPISYLTWLTKKLQLRNYAGHTLKLFNTLAWQYNTPTLLQLAGKKHFTSQILQVITPYVCASLWLFSSTISKCYDCMLIMDYTIQIVVAGRQ